MLRLLYVFIQKFFLLPEYIFLALNNTFYTPKYLEAYHSLPGRIRHNVVTNLV